MKNHKSNTIEFFEKKVTADLETGCHIWAGKPDAHGYGTFCVDRKMYKAHRLSYELYKGPIPTGMLVCHKCDNRICVNPDHLFVGTLQDNMDDRARKDRQAKGERNHSKLKASSVLLIRELSQKRWTQRRLAKEFGVDKSTINNIVNRRKWTHI